MRIRIGAVVVAMATVLALAAPGTASASARSAGPEKFCAKVHASLPRQAHVGDTVEIGTGMENCDAHRAKLKLVSVFTGPCGVKDHGLTKERLGPGEGFGSAAPFEVPCQGRYQLVVEAYYGPSLLDRKVRTMHASP
jgi:hypothetical protein